MGPSQILCFCPLRKIFYTIYDSIFLQQLNPGNLLLEFEIGNLYISTLSYVLEYHLNTTQISVQSYFNKDWNLLWLTLSL